MMMRRLFMIDEGKTKWDVILISLHFAIGLRIVGSMRWNNLP